MSTEVVEGKSKSRRWLVWMMLAVVVAFLGYKNANILKPVANEAYDSLKAAVSGAAPEAIVAAAVTPAATLDNARAAFSNGDFQASLQAYKEYIALDSGNVDARGELGNVYYVSGNYQEAAQTYYDLSKILIGQKQLDQVPALLPVIGQINPSLADELMQQMSQIQQQSFDAQAARQG